MLSRQEVPSLTALTFAAAVAGAAGDAGEERRLIGQALAAVEAGDPDVRLEVVDFISTSGHAAEAVELLEQRLKEALLQPALAVRQVLVAGIFSQLPFEDGDDWSGVFLGAPAGAWHEDHAEVSRAAWRDRVGVERPVVAQVIGDHGSALGPGKGHHLGI